MVGGALLHLFILSLRYLFEGSPLDFQLYTDQANFHNAAAFLAEQWRHGHFVIAGFTDPDFMGGLNQYYPGYAYSLTPIYFVFGPHPFLSSLLNLGVLSGIAMLMYHISLRLTGKTAAMITLVLVLTYPAFADWTYFILRDLIMTFLTVLIAWMVVSYTGPEISVRRVILISLPLIAFLWFRIHMAIMYFALVSLQVYRKTPGRILEAPRLKILSVSLVVLVIGAVLLPSGEGSRSPFESFTLSESPHVEKEGFLEGANLFDLGEMRDRITAAPKSFIQAVVQGTYLTFLGPTWFYARSGAAFARPYQILGAIFMTLLLPFIILGGPGSHPPIYSSAESGSHFPVF